MPTDRHMTSGPRPTFFELLGTIATAAPLTKPKLGQLLRQELRRVETNEYFVLFEGAPATLADGVEISEIDARIAREQERHHGFLRLSVAGRCVPKAEVDRHYAELRLIEMPRGRSLSEETVYQARLPGGHLSFGFAERNPDCLSSATIEFQDE